MLSCMWDLIDFAIREEYSRVKALGDDLSKIGSTINFRRTDAYFGHRPKPEVSSPQAIPLSPRVLIPMLALRSLKGMNA